MSSAETALASALRRATSHPIDHLPAGYLTESSSQRADALDSVLAGSPLGRPMVGAA